MNIPFELQEATDKLLEGRSILNIRNCVSSICGRYDSESGQGRVLVKNSEEAVSYAIARMPGTYGAVRSALEAYAESTDFMPETLTDIGSGTGAAVWAAASVYDFKKVTCFERERSMADIGKYMLSYGTPAMKNAAWILGDVTANGDASSCTNNGDIVTASYIMNELRPGDRKGFLDLLWNLSNNAIILVEPGTKEGFGNIRMAAEYYKSLGGTVIAPCTHMNACPLPDDDWCHFSCRIQRSRTQKYVKGGDAPYEDEKFSYLAVMKTANAGDEGYSRIIRHPIINKGYIELKTCSGNGIENIKVTSRDKERFKAAKKAKWGDRI